MWGRLGIGSGASSTDPRANKLFKGEAFVVLKDLITQLSDLSTKYPTENTEGSSAYAQQVHYALLSILLISQSASELSDICDTTLTNIVATRSVQLSDEITQLLDKFRAKDVGNIYFYIENAHLRDILRILTIISEEKIRNIIAAIRASFFFFPDAISNYLLQQIKSYTATRRVGEIISLDKESGGMLFEWNDELNQWGYYWPYISTKADIKDSSSFMAAWRKNLLTSDNAAWVKSYFSNTRKSELKRNVVKDIWEMFQRFNFRDYSLLNALTIFKHCFHKLNLLMNSARENNEQLGEAEEMISNWTILLYEILRDNLILKKTEDQSDSSTSMTYHTAADGTADQSSFFSCDNLAGNDAKERNPEIIYKALFEYTINYYNISHPEKPVSLHEDAGLNNNRDAEILKLYRRFDKNDFNFSLELDLLIESLQRIHITTSFSRFRSKNLITYITCLKRIIMAFEGGDKYITDKKKIISDLFFPMFMEGYNIDKLNHLSFKKIVTTGGINDLHLTEPNDSRNIILAEICEEMKTEDFDVGVFLTSLGDKFRRLDLAHSKNYPLVPHKVLPPSDLSENLRRHLIFPVMLIVEKDRLLENKDENAENPQAGSASGYRRRAVGP